MGGSSGTQTSTQKSEPWDGQKPYIQEGYKEAQDLYNKGPAQYFQGSTVAGFSPETQNALSAITQQGMGGQQQRAGSQYALDQFSNGGLGDWGTVGQLQQLGANNNYANDPAVSRLGDMSFNGPGTAANLNSRIGDLYSNGGNVAGFSRGAVGDIASNGAGSNNQIRSDTYDLITGAAQNANPAFAQLGRAANGNYLNSNPYLDATMDQAARGLTRNFAEGVLPGLDSAASRAGRYGSGMHANVKDAAGESFGRSLADLSTSIYGGNYQAERGRQDAAASTLGSQYLQGQGLRASTAGQSAAQAAEDARLRLAATGQISGDMGGDVSRRMQAAGMGQGAEASDAAQKLAANAQLSSSYNQGADRQLQSLNSATNAYNAGRGQQLQALGMQPAYQNMNYTDLNAASAAGAQRDQLSQQQLNDQIARFDFGQNADWQNLSRYLSSIQGGSPGATTSMTQSGNGLGGLASLFAGAGGLGQLALGTRGLLW